MTRAARGWGLLIAAAITVGAPSRAEADLALAAPSCEGIDLSALRGLIEVEIGDVAAEWRAVSTPVVLLGCAEDRVRIEITDPVTDKSVARTIAMPDVDRERVLAIAIAQLFLTSWLEILIDEDASTGPGAEAAARRARAAVAEAAAVEPVVEEPAAEAAVTPAERTTEQPAEPAPAEPTGGARVDGELALEGGVRARTDGEQLVTAMGALRGLLVIQSAGRPSGGGAIDVNDSALLVGVRAGFEWGQAFRMRGTIHLYSGALGLVGGWRSPELGPLSLDVVVIASLVALAYEGRPSRPGVVGGTTIAILGEAALELAPSLRAGPVRISLPLSASGVAFAPNGEVTGEAPLVAGGLVVSASLRVSIATQAVATQAMAAQAR